MHGETVKLVCESLSYWPSVLVTEIVATCYGHENELPRCIKTGYVFGLQGHYWLLQWKFIPCCCVAILKESGSEGVDSNAFIVGRIRRLMCTRQ